MQILKFHHFLYTKYNIQYTVKKLFEIQIIYSYKYSLSTVQNNTYLWQSQAKVIIHL